MNSWESQGTDKAATDVSLLFSWQFSGRDPQPRSSFPCHSFVMLHGTLLMHLMSTILEVLTWSVYSCLIPEIPYDLHQPVQAAFKNVSFSFTSPLKMKGIILLTDAQ